MNNETISKMNAYFEKQIALCDQKEKSLRSDGYDDEANFEKVRANIFDVFRTVLSAGIKASKGDSCKTKQFFEEKLVQIPANWKTAFEMAKQHNDSDKMHIEQIKLDAVQEIKETLANIQEEA